MVDVPFVIGLSRTDATRRTDATTTLSSAGFQTNVIDRETLDDQVAPHPVHVPGTPPDPNVILDS
jgi:hypothetical protein